MVSLLGADNRSDRNPSIARFTLRFKKVRMRKENEDRLDFPIIDNKKILNPKKAVN